MRKSKSELIGIAISLFIIALVVYTAFKMLNP